MRIAQVPVGSGVLSTAPNPAELMGRTATVDHKGRTVTGKINDTTKADNGCIYVGLTTDTVGALELEGTWIPLEKVTLA